MTRGRGRFVWGKLRSMRASWTGWVSIAHWFAPKAASAESSPPSLEAKPHCAGVRCMCTAAGSKTTARCNLSELGPSTPSPWASRLTSEWSVRVDCSMLLGGRSHQAIPYHRGRTTLAAAWDVNHMCHVARPIAICARRHMASSTRLRCPICALWARGLVHGCGRICTVLFVCVLRTGPGEVHFHAAVTKLNPYSQGKLQKVLVVKSL